MSKNRPKRQIVSLNEDLFNYRYEPAIEGGTLFIYSFKTQKVLRSNIIGLQIIESIRNRKGVQEIIRDIKKEFPDTKVAKIRKDVAELLKQLEEEELIKHEEERP